MARSRDEALRTELAKRGFESVSVRRQVSAGRVELDANKLHPLPLEQNEVIYAPIPVSLSVALDKQGHIQSIDGGIPDPAAVTDAVRHVRTLRASGQLAAGVADQKTFGITALSPGVTHQIKRDAQGRQVLRRQRFSIAGGGENVKT